ncbi:MAG: hypothetical protein AAF889_03160 [Cyanobacteria bacterium P01_D01_bin.73]
MKRAIALQQIDDSNHTDWAKGSPNLCNKLSKSLNFGSIDAIQRSLRAKNLANSTLQEQKSRLPQKPVFDFRDPKLQGWRFTCNHNSKQENVHQAFPNLSTVRSFPDWRTVDASCVI